MNTLKKWFTLVELLIVVVILSILATVWFISYEDYLIDTRDSKRLSQLTWLRDGLRLATTKWSLPNPDDNVEIRNNGTAFLYQWYAGKNVLESISYSDTIKDPSDDIYYTYLLSRNKRDFQVMGFLEKFNGDVISLSVNNSYAWEDYSQRFPNVFGKKLGIVLEKQTNTPLQEMSEYAGIWYMDLQDPTTNEFDAYITDTFLISWKESDLTWIIPFTTCKKILQTWWSFGDGIYNINPTGLNPFTVYCDMTMDWWGWTLVWRSHTTGSDFDFWWLSSKGSVYDDSSEYSLWDQVRELWFSEIMATTYTTGKNINLAAKVSVSDRNYINDEINYASVSGNGWCEEVYPLNIAWISPCDPMWTDGKSTNDNSLLKWWYIQFINTTEINDTHFFFYKSASNSMRTSKLWLRSNWYLGSSWVAGWGDMAYEQWMIFVR